MMKHYTDQQNYVLNSLAYADIDGEQSWEPGMKLVDLVDDPYKTRLKEAGLDHLEIVDYTNNNGSGSHSGFCAIAFKDPETGERGMSFRGTENLDKITKGANQVDMMDNVHTALLGESVQKKEALEFFERNKSLYGDNYLYGHSKGGELASEVYAENYDEIRQMHIINPQPINPTQLNKKQREVMKSDKVDVVIIDGDTVHSLGEWPFSDENTRIVKNNGSQDDRFFGPHSLEAGEPEGDYYEIEENPFTNYPKQEAFCKASKLIITVAQRGYMPKTAVFVYALASVYTFVVRDIPEAIESFKEAVIRVVETIIEVKENFEKFVKGFNEFIQLTVDKLQRWWNSNFNTGYKYATANPQIKVDTYKLRYYASRIYDVNRRISNLDGRLDSLYWSVGLLDLWKLLQADLMTGYSWRLVRCASYLNDTASDFEATETELSVL